MGKFQAEVYRGVIVVLVCLYCAMDAICQTSAVVTSSTSLLPASSSQTTTAAEDSAAYSGGSSKRFSIASGDLSSDQLAELRVGLFSIYQLVEFAWVAR